MVDEISRREFVRAGAGVVAGAGSAFGQAPAVHVSVRPVVISADNGHIYRNGGPRTAVEEAFQRITRGEDVLDAVIAGVNICELDPLDDSVGYGGLPNADGVVQLDASVMHGPRRRAGAVAALEGVRTPSLVARAVADLTDHHLLVGKGAQDFARQLGFKVEEDLNTEHSRKLWLEWKRRTDPDHYPDPASREAASRKAAESMVRDGLVDERHLHGTINCNGVNAKGEVCGVTTTSGLSWKIPGRVGDSPILGAGLWVDGDVGAAGSTGRGEYNLFNLSAHLIVEEMRRGRHPKDAGMEALRRIRANTVERRLLNGKGNPRSNVWFYVLSRRGEFAGVSLYAAPDSRFAVHTENGPELRLTEGLLGPADRDEEPAPRPSPSARP
jgi:N4-(beta-N-acetylglucosaminyl)-L-asparaginase